MKELIIALLPFIPGLLAPLILWVLSQRGMAKRAKELESLHSRMELVEKLRVSRELNLEVDERNRDVLNMEVTDILYDLEALRGDDDHESSLEPVKLTILRRATLLFRQRSVKGKVYKGVYYFCLFFVIIGGAGITVEFISSGSLETYFTGLLGAAFYLVLGLFFRAGAVRDYKRITNKSKIHKTDYTKPNPNEVVASTA